MNILQTILNFSGVLSLGTILGIVIKHFLDKDRIKTEILLKDKLKAYKIIYLKINSVIFDFQLAIYSQGHNAKISSYIVDFNMGMGDAMFYLPPKIKSDIENFSFELIAHSWIINKNDIKTLELLRDKVQNQIKKELKIKC